MIALVGLLVALAVRLLLGAPGRAASAVLAAGSGVNGVAGRRRGRWRRSPAHRDGRPLAGPEAVTVAVAQVAALLRSGLPPAAAWAALGVRCDPAGVPDADRTARVLGQPRTAAAVVAGARLAADVGAPLASVLDDVVATTVAEEQARSAREAALAGPRATARVLAWLPAAGVLLGYALGADPVGVLLTGGVGTTALAGAALLLVAGRRWTATLVRRARAAGGDP